MLYLLSSNLICLLTSFMTFTVDLGGTDIFTILYSYPGAHYSISIGLAIRLLVQFSSELHTYKGLPKRAVISANKRMLCDEYKHNGTSVCTGLEGSLFLIVR